MKKTKKQKQSPKKEKELAPNVCESCFKATGKEVIMTQRDPESLECPKCNAWKKKPKIEETKAEKIARKKKEIEELEKE